MKVYKLKGVQKYTVAFSKKDALITFFHNRIGVTESNIIETDLEPNRDAIGKVFDSIEELNNFYVEY